MGTEYWIIKCPKFISPTEKQRLKNLAQGLDSLQGYTMEKR